ncbi:Zinc finger protein CONSTANS-like 9 [Vitis vinifera]|uniref:Zinc finger protein CONSTANS-like 9 n=1 Tax=Vitis vinifera TaxID=29760 RepID=A0A438D437_VITVI|nr:Zinc finger protein CONSTANS-like 9 [Vitis vinifera]
MSLFTCMCTEGVLCCTIKAMQPACSNPISADSIISSKTDPNLCFPSRQAHSSLSLSFSGLTGESSTGDYQDCGVSSMLLMENLHGALLVLKIHCLQLTGIVLSCVTRKRKRHESKFEKKIRYASRKARADVRKRVKGRFVKAGDAYDYDPLSQTRSF